VEHCGWLDQVPDNHAVADDRFERKEFSDDAGLIRKNQPTKT